MSMTSVYQWCLPKLRVWGLKVFNFMDKYVLKSTSVFCFFSPGWCLSSISCLMLWETQCCYVDAVVHHVLMYTYSSLFPCFPLGQRLSQDFSSIGLFFHTLPFCSLPDWSSRFGPLYVVLAYTLPPASRFIVILEQVRF